MRTILIGTVSALALLATPVLAQTTGPGPSSATTMRSAAKPDPLRQGDVSEIKGAAVYGSDSKKIGSVTDVLMRPASKQIDRLVVAAGGVLGMGAHDVALPVDQFHWDAQRDGFIIAKTGDELKALPEYKESAHAAGSSDSSSGSSLPPSRTSDPSPSR